MQRDFDQTSALALDAQFEIPMPWVYRILGITQHLLCWKQMWTHTNFVTRLQHLKLGMHKLRNTAATSEKFWVSDLPSVMLELWRTGSPGHHLIALNHEAIIFLLSKEERILFMLHFATSATRGRGLRDQKFQLYNSDWPLDQTYAVNKQQSCGKHCTQSYKDNRNRCT